MYGMSFFVAQFPRVSMEYKYSQIKRVQAGFYCSCPVFILFFHNGDIVCSVCIVYNHLESVSKTRLLNYGMIALSMGWEFHILLN